MAYVNTGYQRSLTMVVDKQVSGVSVTGYPKTYNGMTAFLNYAVITSDELAKLDIALFNQRLADFESYVSNIEGGIDFTTQVVAGYEARRLNEDSCPLSTD